MNRETTRKDTTRRNLLICANDTRQTHIPPQSESNITPLFANPGSAIAAWQRVGTATESLNPEYPLWFTMPHPSGN